MFIAMGYYEGETLKQRIARGPLPVEDARHPSRNEAQYTSPLPLLAHVMADLGSVSSL